MTASPRARDSRPSLGVRARVPRHARAVAAGAPLATRRHVDVHIARRSRREVGPQTVPAVVARDDLIPRRPRAQNAYFTRCMSVSGTEKITDRCIHAEGYMGL